MDRNFDNSGIWGIEIGFMITILIVTFDLFPKINFLISGFLPIIVGGIIGYFLDIKQTQ